MTGTVRVGGDDVGGYTVIRTLGAGGSGRVYLVHDPDGSIAALKLVDSVQDPLAGARLRREVQALTSLRHDAVAQILDAELDDREKFVVFEYISGESLFQYVQTHGPLQGEALAQCAERLAGALNVAHAAGVVHRDVTPSNVMMSPRGAVLIDFGLSHRTDDERLTRDGMVSGTAGYVAPEVIDGAEPGPEADKWAWAATVAFAMSGTAPFGVGSASIRRTLEGQPEVADGLGADYLRAALGRDVGARPSMSQVIAALRGATEVLKPLPPTQVMPAGVAPDPGEVSTAVVPAGEATRVLEVEEWVPADGDAQWDGAGWDDADGDEADGDQAGWDDAEWDDADGEEGDWDYSDESGRGSGRSYPHRPVMLLAWTLTVSLGAALAPFVSFGLLVLGALTGRATYRRHEAILAARLKHGERRRDAVLHTMGLPWHMTRAFVELLPSVLVAAVIGAVVSTLGWQMVSRGLAAPLTEHGQAWGHAVALAVGAMCAAASLWWGLFSGGTREGAHRFAAALTPTGSSVGLWVAVALVAVAGVVVAVALMVDPWWAPLPPLPVR